MNVGAQLTHCRESLGLSKNQLAKQAGISQSYISDIESGKKNPTIDILEKISDALGISVIQLLKDTSETEILEPDIQQLIDITKKLPPEERRALNEYLKIRLRTMEIKEKVTLPFTEQNHEINAAAYDGNLNKLTTEEIDQFKAAKEKFRKNKNLENQ